MTTWEWWTTYPQGVGLAPWEWCVAAVVCIGPLICGLIEMIGRK